MTKQLRRERDWTARDRCDGVAWLTLDKADASANSLSRAVMEELDAMLAEARARAAQGTDRDVRPSSGFIAGADIREFVGMRTPDAGVST